LNGTVESSRTQNRRGRPLAVLGMLFAVWIMGRVALWESPFPIDQLDMPVADLLLAENSASHTVPDAQTPDQDFASPPSEGPVQTASFEPSRQDAAPQWADFSPQIASPMSNNNAASSKPAMTSIMAGGHQLLMAAAFRVDWAVEAAMAPTPSGNAAPQWAGGPDQRTTANAVPTPVPFIERSDELDRWSLDMFAYFRQGSNSSLISQGRAPLFGASQISANLQYRIAPRSGHDPRAYIRAYRALVTGGESEVAAGLSARPVPAVPVRVAAEIRVTDNVFGVEQRPATYAVTEIAPISMPLDFRLEAYGSAGYVGGRGATAFADGQVAMTRELVRFNGPSSQPIRFTLGAGAWGGVQEDARRIDVGPTMRVDLSVGDVPARLSVDWREQVAGDAAPSSGVAATLSTRF